MADIPDYDPTKDDTGTDGGATEGGDDDTQDWSLPGGPTDSPDEQRRRWPGGARRKNPYAYQRLPHDDKDIPMTEFPKEKNGLPKQKGTVETSFTEGLDYDTARVLLENGKLEYDFPKYKDSIERLTLEYRVDKNGKGRIWVKGPDKGWYPLYMADEKTLNPKLPKTIRNVLGPKRTELIQQKDEEIEELDKTIEEDTRVADDENEQPSVRERARERITENTERRDQRIREREQLAEKLPLRERLKNLFKKHGFTIATVVTAVGITIGVLAKILADGASVAANGIKIVGKKVGDGLKELGKRIGAILPGLVGAIASFVFRAAGQAISFLAKNAWLLVLAVVAFMIQKLTEKK